MSVINCTYGNYLGESADANLQQPSSGHKEICQAKRTYYSKQADTCAQYGMAAVSERVVLLVPIISVLSLR